MSPEVKKEIFCIILAAGKSKRFKTQTPKVLHRLLGKPMICYLLDITKKLRIKKTYLVCGYKDQDVKEALKGTAGLEFIKQKKLLGSGDAVNSAKTKFLNKNVDVLVLYADTPLLNIQTIRQLVLGHKTRSLSATILTTRLSEPSGYGRIIRARPAGKIESIIEESDATDEQKKINEVNAGVYCFKSADLFSALSKIKPRNAQKEYYLTDVISVLAQEGKHIGNVDCKNPDEILGINTRIDLARANAIVKNQISKDLMLEGVTIVDPSSTFIESDVKIGKDTTILPFVIIEKGVKIGANCTIGPFCRLRDGVNLKDNVQIGNFVELVRSDVDRHSKIKHHSYIGDTSVGKFVNVGAGTITANYDGINKHRTKIQDGAFVGSGTVFVAPVKVGKNALTGAGSVVIKGHDVPAGTVVVGIPAKILKKVDKKRLKGEQKDED